MSKSLVPQAFWFRVAAPCTRIDSLPRADLGKGRLLDLPESTAIPSLATLDQREPWASVRLAWNPKGLAIAVIADGIETLRSTLDRPEGSAAVQLWVDTRDARDISRATRFCHRFTARLVLRRGKTLEVDFAQRPIARAVSDAPIARVDIPVRAEVDLDHDRWMLEVFLPAEALHGYEPETNPRLGFAYQVTDLVRDDQFLGIGRDFPLGENPSLWSTIELQG
jgi:hypothetical protein